VDESSVASVVRPEQSEFSNMIWIPGGTFRMGSDNHYPEEAPVRRVTVSGFWIDRTPVTNRQFKEFVRATGHVTFAEFPRDPKNFPGALPHMLYAGSLVWRPRARLASVRAELLPLPPGRSPCGSGGYVHEPRRLSLGHQIRE
jgi:formylglycine-generating enzyme